MFSPHIYADQVSQKQKMIFFTKSLKSGETVMDFYYEPISEEELIDKNETLSKEV